MSRRRVEASDSWRPMPRSHAAPPPSMAILRAGPRLPAFASLSVRVEGGGGEAVKAVVEGAVAVVEGKAKEERARGEAEKSKERRLPPAAQLVEHPLALLALVPNSAALFAAGAAAGAVAKTVTAPLDRVKLLMQTHSVRVAGESAKKGVGFLEALTDVGKKDGLKGYWKGNLPQVIRIIPYSAVQLFSYEVTYPLDVLRLRLAVQSGHNTMSQVALNMLREEGLASFYRGLGPSLIAIAPYIAVNFCVFDLMKKSVPEKYRNRPETSLATALLSATFATLMCYPLDTVRRQMQMKGTPYNTIFDAVPGIVERDGLIGLYRGFVPNALKNLPNSSTQCSLFCFICVSIKLTAFDTVKTLISTGQKELEKLIQENQEKDPYSS
ncbi:hypothetical protein PR202_ga23945 [Eleusine coracana subsp. coracana]|uniref:Uncharacterized protein n=1 Tax=Eleusine coracana subsp. coracana TaxID=191504 RepID=A0AAV5D7X4_ELECO|nr:hypothetical protein PR202_ga23945 [Eleusine coracana subsp. coracana]